MEPDCSLIKTSLLESIGGNVETFSVTWLDTSVNEGENVDIQNSLRVNINYVKTFEKLDECRKYIEDLSCNDRTILIVSGSLGRILVPSIYKYLQISSIYVFCMDQELNELWAKDFEKIKGVITDNDDLVNTVQKDYKQQEKIGAPIAFTVLRKEVSDDGSLSVLNSQLAYSHLLIDFLLRLKPNFGDKLELFCFCRDLYRDDTFQLAVLKRFESSYSSSKALQWYTDASFPHQMLNKALRTQNIHLLYIYRFFMSDIYHQLLQHQYKTAIRTYRGQYMSKGELEVFQNSVGKMISLNSFLSTSSDRSVALRFINDSQSINNDVQRIIFEIDADPAINTTKPFASIRQFSDYGDEAEVLFSMNSVFRITEVYHEPDNIWIIEMKLCDDETPDLKPIIDYVKTTYTDDNINPLSFCELLYKMKKFSDAEIYNRRHLQMPSTNLLDTSICYYNLGGLSLAKHDYDESIKWHKKTLEIELNSSRPNDSNLARTYFALGLVYEKKHDYQQASECFNKALKVWKSISGKNYTDVIKCYRKLGRMKEKLKKYSHALAYYKKILTFWTREHVPTDDIQLGRLYADIGYVHQRLKHNAQALENYNLALRTYQTCIPITHLYVAALFEKIAVVYAADDILMQSLIYFEKTEEICRKILPVDHPDLIRIEMNIQNIQSRLKGEVVF